MAGERIEFCELLVQNARDQIQIHLKITVDQDIAKTGNAAESFTEVRRQYASLYKTVDCCAIRGRVLADSGTYVAGDVQGVLRRQMQSTLDGPETVPVGAKHRSGHASMPPEPVDRLAQRDDMPLNDAPVHLTRRHGQSLFLRDAYRRAASIFSICGTKSRYRDRAIPARWVVALRSRDNSRMPSRNTLW